MNKNEEIDYSGIENWRFREDCVLVRFDDPDEYMHSDLIAIPEQHQELNKFATVISVGPGVLNKNGVFLATECRAGDTVILDKCPYQVVVIDGVDHHVIREADVLAIVGGRG